MVVRSIVFQNLSLGPLYGVMGFRVVVQDGGNQPPSSCAKLIAESIRRTIKTQPGSIPVVFDDSMENQELYSLFYHLRQEKLPYQLSIVLLIERGTLGQAGVFADIILIRCTESTWTGVIGNGLIMVLEEGRTDPTDGYPPTLYPLGYWLEKGEQITNEQFVLYTLKYPKWRIVVPPRITYSMVVYREQGESV